MRMGIDRGHPDMPAIEINALNVVKLSLQREGTEQLCMLDPVNVVLARGRRSRRCHCREQTGRHYRIAEHRAYPPKLGRCDTTDIMLPAQEICQVK